MMNTNSTIEILEARIAPANITATVVGHLLLIVGTDDANLVTINGDAGDATKFVVSSGDLINGSVSDFTTPAGVTDISIKTLGGGDSVNFATTTSPFHLTGSLKIDGGVGANRVTAFDVTVDKSITITNG